MSWFWGTFDPYHWLNVRNRGKGLYFVDHGLLPGLIAGIAYAGLMAYLDSALSPYINAALFSLAATPIYIWLSHRTWEMNEDALAVWVADEGRRLMAVLEEQGDEH